MGGPCVPPTPSQKDPPPPLKNLFSVLGQGRRRTELEGLGKGRAVTGQTSRLVRWTPGRGVLRGRDLCTPSHRFSLSGSR